MKTLWFICLILCPCVFSTLKNKEPIEKVVEEVKDAQAECLAKKYTFNSCFKVFCAPWQRCLDGRCICKLPYQCPQNGTTAVCTEKEKKFKNYCHLKSAECANPIHRFSSAGPCGLFEISLTHKKQDSKGIVTVNMPNVDTHSLVCSKGWNIREANVACKQLGFAKGADASFLDEVFDVPDEQLKDSNCLEVKCRGLENSLAECNIKHSNLDGKQPAGVVCYTETRDCTNNEFSCANGKCISASKPCNGENDCGDLSDELCCSECKNSFHCKSDTCIPLEYKCNNEVDCITGDDESNCTNPNKDHDSVIEIVKDHDSESEPDNAVNYDMDAERKLLRKSLPHLHCGTLLRSTRQKRIIGGEKAKKNQFPWQVAIKDGLQINCGGIYIGGCWVLTAAHCVRENQPQKYRIIIELLDRLSYDTDIDSFPVKAVKIHEQYNSNTYENDIALLEVVNIYQKDQCMQVDNNLVPACLPWSHYQFKAGDTCVVSGWGRAEGLSRVFHLKWGHIHLMDNCSTVYGNRFLDKMECAGTYDGSIDACKGDSGGPLVCYDSNNVAYLWGIVSWGENCGIAGFPGVYTKVAHYFEWVARKVGRHLIAQYNI